MIDQDFKNLTILHSHLQDKKPLSDELEKWLLSGLNKLSTGEAKTIDECLSLKGRPGVDSVGNRLQKNTRNRLLIQLVKLVGHNSQSRWDTAKKTSVELNKFYRRKNNILKLDKSKRSEIDKLLLNIFEVDEGSPTSEAFIYYLEKHPFCL